MYSTFLVSTSECMACDNQVLKTLGTLQGVFGVEMDRIEGHVTVTHTEEVTRAEIAQKLSLLGFPEREEEKVKAHEPSEEKYPEKDKLSINGCVL